MTVQLPTVRPAPRTYPWDQPLGASPSDDGTTTFRVWAPHPSTVGVRIAGVDHPLIDEGYGVRSVTVPAGHGDDYQFVLDGTAMPDPCSRWQPGGIRGPSRVLDPARFAWNDGEWAPPTMDRLVIYEIHIGTFSAEGTFDSAMLYLPALAELGVTTVEVMPIAEFPGHRGWGYDGVYLSAAESSYGGPKALARFVNAAHRVGIAVLLDVVYNHVGASGSQALTAFGPYFTDDYQTPWGDALNFDDADCDPVRSWVRQSAVGWVRDFHVDGLRLDAVHAMHDESPVHVVAEIASAVRAERPNALVIAESGMNDPRVIRPPELGGWGLDGAWADDFHHALRALLTGDHSGWYEEFGEVAQLAKAFHRPHVHDGQYSTFRKRRFARRLRTARRRSSSCSTRTTIRSATARSATGSRMISNPWPRCAPSCRRSCRCCSWARTMANRRPSSSSPTTSIVTSPTPPATDVAASSQRSLSLPAKRYRILRTAPRSSGRSSPGARTHRSAPCTVGCSPRRRDLPPGDADAIDHDEEARWLRVRRGPYELIANFADEERHVPTAGTDIIVATHETSTSLGGGLLGLPAKAGALVRGTTA